MFSSGTGNIINHSYFELFNETKDAVNTSYIARNRDTWSAVAEKYNPAYDTKILVHGWKSSIQSDSITTIKGAYTKKGRLNVFGNINNF